jgi:hypothetical protein
VADHKVEQIMVDVQTLITGLATTASRVARGRVYPHPVAPALSLFQGQSVPLNDSFPLQDSELTVNIVGHSRAGEGATDTELNQIAKEVVIALLADTTLGGTVIRTRWSGNQEPSLSGEGDKPISSMIMSFLVHYRHSYTDHSA